jgi:hypothetical protein
MWRTSRIITSPRAIQAFTSGISPLATRAMPSSFESMCVPGAYSIGPLASVTSTSGKLTASW